jgi:alginate O-acetyltransferase complex protein AlgI
VNITSLPFTFFTLVVLGVYYALPHRAQNIWLLLISYVFLIFWDWRFALVMAIVTAANFLLAQRTSGQRRMLWFGLGFNIFILIFFRMMQFFLPGLEGFLARFGVPTQAGGLQILIPLGLSYYVLQNISYLVDVYRGQVKASTNAVDFALYLAYFPKLVAGPIERARSFLPKLSQPREVDNTAITRSLMLIFVGVVRKLILADILTALILTDVFQIPAKYTPPELTGWLVIYAFAIYNDFAGYTDIVRGVSGLFGIELSPNFQAPYFSRNFTEFWKRWHISLSEWLRDYVYYPLSRALLRRNRNPTHLANLILPPMITMLVSGLWHGVGLHMLLWGAMHGVYQILERVISFGRPRIAPQDQPWWRQGVAMAVVFACVMLAWVPFRWELPVAFDFWGALFNWSSFAIRYRRLFFVVPFLLASLAIDFFQYHGQNEFVFLKWPRPVQAACMALILLLIFVVTGEDFGKPFVYQLF